MRIERERSVPRRPQVLVVSAPGDPRAVRLSDDLQEIGWRVILADTPELAEDYAETSFCVVVLRARQWNAASIAATVRARPAVLIPVLAESMDLPRGPWTFEPIPMESPRQVANEVAEALDDAARSQRPAGASRGPGPSASYPPRGEGLGAGVGGYTREPRGPIDRSGPYGRGGAGGGAESFARSMPNRASVRVGVPPPPPPPKKSGAGRAIGIIVTLLVLAGLGFGGVKYGYPYVKRHYLTTAATTTAKPAPYAANLPGPGCDTGTSKANWQPLSDSNVSGTCQASNYLLKQSGNFGTAAEVFFAQASYPRSYQIGITGTIVSGDANVAVGIDVHHQLAGGGHLFAAYKGGTWHAILGTAPGGTPKRLGFGFLAKTDTTFTMLVDVQGPTMTFTVNGTKVVTLTDGSFPTTDAVAFFLYDFGATAPASATFSQFTYTPETPPALSTSDLLATATAQATAAAKQPYTADVPGSGCDKGTGQWQPQFLQAADTTTQCDTKGLAVTQNPKTDTHGAVEFFGPNGLLVNDYLLSTKVALDATTTCGGFITRISAEGTSFDRLVVCGNGLWSITSIVSGAAKGAPLNGFVTPALSYTIAVNVKGTTQVLSINGTQITTLTDTNNSTTYALGYAVVALGGAPGTATFTSFSYTMQ